MDPGILLFVIPVALTLFVAWIATRDAYDPLPFATQSEIIRRCLTWVPPSGIKCQVYASASDESVRVILTEDADEHCFFVVAIPEDESDIAGALDWAVEELRSFDSDEYKRIINRRGEHN